jgi:hypothetical protein
MQASRLLKIAAKIHIRAAASEARPFHRNFIGMLIAPHAPKDLIRLFREIDRDIGQQLYGLSNFAHLHGDLHFGNLLKDDQDVTSVIDWDHHFIGRPELDLRLVRWLPQHLKTICSRYNETADVPISEKVMAGLGLADAFVRYLRDKKYRETSRYFKGGRDQYLRLERQRIEAFSGIMYRITGKKIYLATAKNFTDTRHPSRPVQRYGTSLPTQKPIR